MCLTFCLTIVTIFWAIICCCRWVETHYNVHVCLFDGEWGNGTKSAQLIRYLGRNCFDDHLCNSLTVVKIKQPVHEHGSRTLKIYFCLHGALHLFVVLLRLYIFCVLSLLWKIPSTFDIFLVIQYNDLFFTCCCRVSMTLGKLLICDVWWLEVCSVPLIGWKYQSTHSLAVFENQCSSTLDNAKLFFSHDKRNYVKLIILSS